MRGRPASRPARRRDRLDPARRPARHRQAGSYPTDEPFQPLTSDQLQTVLHQGPFADYQLLKTEHYLIFYKSTPAFAQDSGRLLEDLYRGLIDAFRRNEIPVHESEFPLVAVIFATEARLPRPQAGRPPGPGLLRVLHQPDLLLPKSDRDRIEPKVAALLKPQTVAHEGAHQILCNIGVQPRPSDWPLWLVEGLAEYCATTVNTKKGIAWGGMGAINSLHMATIRELEDPLSNQINGSADSARQGVARRGSTVAGRVAHAQDALTPTDYAEAWALTHYLAQTARLRLRQVLEGDEPDPSARAAHARAKPRRVSQVLRLDLQPSSTRSVDDYIHKLSQKKTYDSLVLLRRDLPAATG